MSFSILARVSSASIVIRFVIVACAVFWFGAPVTLADNPPGPIDLCVPLTATVTTSPPTISLAWPAATDAVAVQIRRRSFGDARWQLSRDLPLAADTFVDTSIVAGRLYEYAVLRARPVAGKTFPTLGCITSGIDVPLNDDRGTVLLIVDSSCARSLKAELDRLREDLRGDGWSVLRHDVGRRSSVASVKALIKADYERNPTRVKAVLLFGHIPVPYSGNKTWDGHAEHLGACPADVYYADVTGEWTDTLVDNSAPHRPENKNVIGDGKFDQDQPPGKIALQIGRVDLSNMPAFPIDEVELLRQYLDKNHRYRHKEQSVENHAVITDRFGLYAGGPASSGWRSFIPAVGQENIEVGEIFPPEMPKLPRLWAYACGPGDFEGVSSMGRTGDFAARGASAEFYMLFGSYFGEWNTPNSFLRAPLAASNAGLASVWSGYPKWLFHPMAMGATLGECTRLSQMADHTQYLDIGPNARGVHMALMGDPTLRMHVIAPPRDVTITNEATGQRITWRPSSDQVDGYFVYGAKFPEGPFSRLTPEAVQGPSTIVNVDDGPFFQVRATKLERTPSGTYHNASQAAVAVPASAGPVK